MKSFRDSEKQRLIPIMKNLFSPAAIAQPGYMKKYNHSYPFCLVDSYADENLHSFIRTDAIRYFQTRNIQWHDGTNGNPSNHLCCSQSFCINALFPFQSRPDKLKELLLEIGYPVEEVLPIGPDSCNNTLSYLAFEWIGAKNYLNELSGGKLLYIQREQGEAILPVLILQFYSEESIKRFSYYWVNGSIQRNIEAKVQFKSVSQVQTD